MKETDVERLGRQLAEARRTRDGDRRDVADRAMRQPSLVGGMAAGRADPTVHDLADAGRALGMALTFVPEDRLGDVIAFLERRDPKARAPISVYDELAVEFEDEEWMDEKGDHAGP